MDLDRPVDDVVQDLRTPELDHADLHPGIAVMLALGVQLIHLPCCLQGEQTSRLHLGPALRDPVLDHLLLGEDAAVRVPGQRPFAQHVERALTLAEPPHRMMDPAWSESLLSECESLADPFLPADHVLERHADVLVQDLGVSPWLAGLVIRLAHRRDVAKDVHARCAGRHDDHRESLVGRLARVAGLAHHDQKVGDRRVRREPLVTVDHPFLTVAHRRCTQQRRVGAGVGLGHTEATAHRTFEQRLHPPLALLGRSPDGQQFGVTAVRRVVPEHARGVSALAEDLVHQAELDLAETHSAHVRWQVRRPQSLFADLFLERCDNPREHLPTTWSAEFLGQRLQRDDLLAHEGAHPRQLGLELGLGFEIPCHRRLLRLSGVATRTKPSNYSATASPDPEPRRTAVALLRPPPVLRLG